MFRSIILLAALALTVIPGPAWAQRSESSIAAVVNDEAISAADVAARTKLILTSSGIPNTEEMREKMRPQIVGSLIDERLMMQEAGRNNIVVSPQDIENGFATIAQQNNMTADQFLALLGKAGIPRKTLADQIEAQVAWGQVVQSKIRPRITIAENDINAFLDRVRNDIGKTQYLISEIYLPVENPKDESSVRQLADKLMRQMTESHAPFPRVAAQFSQSAGASRGGDMGWVREGELPEEIDKVLVNMQEGGLSQPIRSLTGYHIVLLRKKSVMAEGALPSREEVYNKLGTEELDRRQRRLLLDLKAAAFIENRV